MAERRTYLGCIMQAGPKFQARPDGQQAQFFDTEPLAQGYFNRNPRSLVQISDTPVPLAPASGRVVFEPQNPPGAETYVKVFLITTYVS